MSEAEPTNRDLAVMIAGMGGRFDNVNDRLDKVDAYLGKVDAHLDRVDAYLDKIDAHLEKVDARLDKHDHRLDSLFAELAKTRADIMERIDRLQHGLAALRDDQIVTFGAVEKIDRERRVDVKNMETTNEQLGIMFKRIRNLDERLSAIEAPKTPPQ